MNRLSVFVLMLGLFTVIGFIGCGDSDDGPMGPTLSVPHDLVAVPVSSNSIALEWVDEDMVGSGFHVERGSGANWSQIAELEYDLRTYTDTELEEGTTYQYRIKTYGRESESAPSNTAEATTLPQTPSELSAERMSGSSIALSWTNITEIGSGVEIQRSLQAGAGFDSIAVTAADVETFTDTGLAGRTAYFYRIRALHNGQGSLWSNVTRAVTTVFTPFPPTITEVDALSDTEILLSLSRQAPDPIGILIERSLTGNDGWSVDSLAGDTRSFIASDLMSSTMYYFRGIAFNDSGSSEYSEIVSEQTEAGPPMAPDNFEGSAEDYTMVTLSWRDNSNDETGFRIQRKISVLNFWDDPVEIAADVEEWNDEDISPGNTYNYRLAAFNDIGNSAWSPSIEVIVPEGPPNAPSNLVATPLGIQRIRLTWRTGDFNTTGYLIERKAEGEAPFRLMDDTRNQFFIDEGLDPETWYSYRVIAYKNIDGDFLESGPSNVDSAQTHSLLAFSDDFEPYALNRPPDNEAYRVDQEGSSTCRVTDDSNHAGEQGLKFIDQGVADGNMSRIWIGTRPLERGNIGIWIKLAPDGHFGFIGANTDSIITFQLQLNDDNTFAFRDGGALDFSGNGFPVDEWAYFEFIFDFETHIYNIFINDNQVTEDPSVQNDNLQENSIFIMLAYSDVTIDYVFVDDLLFEEAPAEEGQMTVPIVPNLPTGLQKVSDLNIFNIQR